MKRVIVIGGGLGGLSAALALRRAGVDATVYHRGEFAEVPAAVVIWPNAARVLRDWGLLGPLLQNGRVLSRIELLKPDGRAMASIPLPGADEPAVCLHRAELHSALRSALPETSLVPNRRLVSLTRGATQVSAEFEGGLKCAGDGLVGADGARSAVRALAVSGVAPVYRGYRVWRAIASDPGGIKRDQLSETWGRSRRFGIVPMGRERVCWYATHNGPPLPRAADPADTRRHLQTLFAGWHDPVRALIEATDPEGIVGADACDAPPLPRWGEGRVTLLGDAAHPLTPNVGQGACSAIEDAAVLARCAQEAADLPEAFFAYESERRPQTAALIRRARRIGILGQLENPCLVAARDWSIRAAMKFNIVRPSRLMLYEDAERRSART